MGLLRAAGLDTESIEGAPSRMADLTCPPPRSDCGVSVIESAGSYVILTNRFGLVHPARREATGRATQHGLQVGDNHLELLGLVDGDLHYSHAPQVQPGRHSVGGATKPFPLGSLSRAEQGASPARRGWSRRPQAHEFAQSRRIAHLFIRSGRTPVAPPSSIRLNRVRPHICSIHLLKVLLATGWSCAILLN